MFNGLYAKYQPFLSDFTESSNFLDKFSKNPEISNLMRIRPVEAELFTSGRADTTNEDNSRF
jgi:hypothetical protein